MLVEQKYSKTAISKELSDEFDNWITPSAVSSKVWREGMRLQSKFQPLKTERL